MTRPSPVMAADRSIFQAFPRPLKGWKKNEDGFHSPFSRLSLFPPLDILFVSVLQVSWAELPHREYYFSLGLEREEGGGSQPRWSVRSREPDHPARWSVFVVLRN